MNGKPHLALAKDADELGFGPNGELRETFAETGRIHIDRWLPFLVIHCTDQPETSEGRRVAVNSPAYLIWSPEEQVEAEGAMEVILDRLQREVGPVLLIELHDAPFEPEKKDAPKLPRFKIRTAASQSKAAAAALEAFRTAAADITIDLRQPEISVDPAFPPLLDGVEAPHRISLTIPPIHRSPEGDIYPQMAHDLAAALIDSLLFASAAFMGANSNKPPPHHRSLGRSAFLAAALKADRKLDWIARSFDFLLSISPINTAEAKAQFFEGGEQKTPDFHYRPLTIDPDAIKRELYALDLSILEDMLLERLLCEKRHEIDMQLTMLASRNTSGFRPASMLLYGVVTPDLLNSAHTILQTVRPRPGVCDRLSAMQVAAAAKELVARYRSIDGSFEAIIEVRDDVAGLLVSGGTLMIASDTCIAANRLDPLLAHEVSVHLLTYFNGANQGLTIFRTGLAHYEGIQEGLGVFAEWAVGGLTTARLRLLAGRVVAVHAMIDGASFVDAFRRLSDDFGFSKTGAFNIAARVFRSGGLAKDAIYLKGFLEILDRVATGGSLDAFWLGKIAPEHVDAVDELLDRGLLHRSVFVPEFLGRYDAQARVERLRGGEPFDRILE